MSIALFFLSPLVAEFLLGDFTLAQLGFLILLAPAYGGAAVVIRELTRRTGRGWPTMILLALAYGVIEEGLETQSLFNPDYLDAHLLDHGFLPWAIFVLTIHTVWSMSVPIALVEEWTDRRTVPWLKMRGLLVFAALALIGGAGTFAFSYADGHFMANPAQLIVTAVVAVALIVLAFRLPSARPSQAGVAPRPWVVLLVTLAAGSLLMLGRDLPTAVAVPLVLVALAAVAAALLTWSRRRGFDGRHRFAAAAGALLTYTWHSFTMSPVASASSGLVLVSHVVFALGALVLLSVEARRVWRRASLPSTVAVSR